MTAFRGNKRTYNNSTAWTPVNSGARCPFQPPSTISIRRLVKYQGGGEEGWQKRAVYACISPCLHQSARPDLSCVSLKPLSALLLACKRTVSDDAPFLFAADCTRARLLRRKTVGNARRARSPSSRLSVKYLEKRKRNPGPEDRFFPSRAGGARRAYAESRGRAFPRWIIEYEETWIRIQSRPTFVRETGIDPLGQFLLRRFFLFAWFNPRMCHLSDDA